MSIDCVSWGCEGVSAVRYVSCESEGRYPYCEDCARTLLSGGEIDRGLVERPVEITDEMVKRAWAAWRASADADENHDMRAALEAALEVEP